MSRCIVRRIVYIAKCIDGPLEDFILTMPDDKFHRLLLPSTISHYPHEYVKVDEQEKVAGGFMFYIVQPYKWIKGSGI